MFKGGHEATDGGNGESSGPGLGALAVPPTGGSEQQTRSRIALDTHPLKGALVDGVHGPTRDAEGGTRTPERRPRRTGDQHRQAWMGKYVAGLVGIDFVAAAAAVATAFFVRFAIPANPADAKLYIAFGVLLPLAWLAVVALNRAYEARYVGVGPAEFQRVGRAFLHLIALVAIVSYASKADIARGFVLVALPMALVLDLCGRYAARKWLHRQRSRGRAMTSVLAVGEASAIASFTSLVRRDRHAGMRVVGACLPSETEQDPQAGALLAESSLEVHGDVDSVLDAVHASGADTVAVVSSGEVSPEKLRWISWQLEGTDTDLFVSPGLMEVAGRRLHIQPVAGLPLLHVEEPEFRGFRRVLKNTLDRVVASVMVLLLAPVFLALWLAVRLTSRGPGFFRQTRVGRYGQPFTMLKFRSMYQDAESRLEELQAHNVNSDGLLFKMHDDPRVTPAGRFLRKFSLDELPQLINVITGRMSLVGPRPPLPSEVARYADDVRRRLLVKPGVTGLWQVSGRNDLSWEESVRLDLRYVENWSPALDLMILWKTGFAVLGRSGAY